MSYNINLPNGSSLGTIIDGTVDTTHTSLSLVGRNYSNYGQFMVDDFVALMVNFARDSQPNAPQVGQLWYNTSTQILNVCTSNSPSAVWEPVGTAQASDTAPTTTVAGSLWWTITNKQFYVYDGTTPYSAAGWILVGPGFPNGYVTGPITETLSDGSAYHYISSLWCSGVTSNTSVRVAIVSKDSFTPTPTLSGFTNIKSGINLASGYTLWGTANNASYLGGLPSNGYWYYNQNNLGYGSLSILSNVGIQLGNLGLFYANVTSTGTGRLYNTYPGGNVSFHVNSLVNGQEKALWVSGLDGNVYVANDPGLPLGVATKQYVDNSFNNTTLTGVPTAPNPSAGNDSQQLATTHFVTSGLSGLYSYKVYTSNTWVWTGTTSVNVVVSGTTVATASASGFNLTSGATAVTQSDSYNGSGNSAIATTQFVKNANQWWGGSAKFISNAAPNPGVNDIGSNNGDFWFQIAN